MKPNQYPKEYLETEKKSFYRKLLNQIPDLVFQIVFDVNGVFRLSYVNRSIIKYFDVQDCEIKNSSLESITKRIYPKDLSDFYQSLYSSKEKHQNWKHEFRIIGKSTPFVWFRVDASIEKDDEGNSIFFGRFLDVNENILKELKIKETADRFNFALDASNSGVWDYDVASDEIFYSAQSLKMLDLEMPEGRYSADFWDTRIHPEDYQTYIVDFHCSLSGKCDSFENTKRLLGADGITYKWIYSKGQVIEKDQFGSALRIIGTHTDVTIDMHREKQLLKNLEIISHQNNRLLNFAHIVSHNLRSHTGNFRMLLSIMDDEKDEAQQKQILKHLNTTSNALADTIEHLKELVDIHSTLVHKKERLNLNDYLQKTLLLLETEIASNEVTIINKLDKSSSIEFTPAYLESVFLNFTTNAIKYAFPNRNAIIEFSSEIQNNKLVLCVKDNGLGINLEKHGNRLFGMYKTFHKNSNSRGLGLFITKNQIEAMNGTVEVESQVNIGTTFKITFHETI
jgi:signal transduction histidine kinase